MRKKLHINFGHIIMFFIVVLFVFLIIIVILKWIFPNNFLIKIVGEYINNDNIDIISFFGSTALTITIILFTITKDKNEKDKSILELIDTLTLNHCEQNYLLYKIVEEFNNRNNVKEKNYDFLTYFLKMINDVDSHKGFRRKIYRNKVIREFFNIYGERLPSIDKDDIYRNIKKIIQTYKQQFIDDFEIAILIAYSIYWYTFIDVFPKKIINYLKHINNKQKVIHFNCYERKYVLNYFYKEMRYALMGIEEMCYAIDRDIADFDLFKNSYIKESLLIFEITKYSLQLIGINYLYTQKIMQKYKKYSI